MPNCFTLRKIGATENSRFADIDDELRIEFKQEPDDKNYLWMWYDIIGLRLACGQTFDEMLNDENKKLEMEELRKIAEYLQKNYTTDAWYQNSGFSK